MIKVSWGSPRYCGKRMACYSIVTWQAEWTIKMGEEGEFLSEGLDWRRRSTAWLNSAGESEEGKWIQEVSVIRETKPNVQVRLRDRFCARKRNSTPPLPFVSWNTQALDTEYHTSIIPARTRQMAWISFPLQCYLVLAAHLKLCY